MSEKEKHKNNYNGGGSSGVIYERRKWVKDKNSGKNNSVNCSEGVKFNRALHMYYNKGCGWNKNHTTGLHSNYKANLYACRSQLPTTHPYCQMIMEHIPGMHTQPPPYQVPPYDSTNLSSLTLT